MAIKTFISFSPSPFLCNLLVSSPGYVSCLVCLFENQWCGALSHFPPPASAGSLLFPLPEPFACFHPGQGQNAVGTPADVAFLHLLTHLFSPIPCLPAWGLLCCLKSSYLDFLVLPTPSWVLEYIRQTLQHEGSVDNQWGSWWLSLMGCSGALRALGWGGQMQFSFSCEWVRDKIFLVSLSFFFFLICSSSRWNWTGLFFFFFRFELCSGPVQWFLNFMPGSFRESWAAHCCWRILLPAAL